MRFVGILADLIQIISMMISRPMRFSIVLRFKEERQMREMERRLRSELQQVAVYPVSAWDDLREDQPRVYRIMDIPLELECEEANWRTVSEGRVRIKVQVDK